MLDSLPRVIYLDLKYISFTTKRVFTHWNSASAYGDYDTTVNTACDEHAKIYDQQYEYILESGHRESSE